MSKKKSALGDNPLEHLIPTSSSAPEPPSSLPVSSKKRARRERGASLKKTRATFHLPEELLERARDTVYWLSGPPTRLTLTELVTEALTRELRRLEKAHNEGNQFQARDEELRGGRPSGR